MTNWFSTHYRKCQGTRFTTQRDDRGASLVLALAVLFATSLVAITLVGWIGNALGDTLKLTGASQMEYATGAAVQTEIQTLRYEYTGPTYTTGGTTPYGTSPFPLSSSPVNCTPGTSSGVTINSQKVKVWCTGVWQYGSAATRTVTLSSCDSGVGGTGCVAAPFLQVTVSFNDYSLADQDNCRGSASQTTCGTAMTITTWTIG